MPHNSTTFVHETDHYAQTPERPRHDDAPSPPGAPAGAGDAHGPDVVVLTDPTPARDDQCVARAVLPPGTVVPAHSHGDRVAFYVVAGELEGWRGGGWRTLRPGDVLDVPEYQLHAVRNRSREDVTLILVTTRRTALACL